MQREHEPIVLNDVPRGSAEWTRRIEAIQDYLIEADPPLERVFRESSVDWDEFVKTPFVAVVATIVGRVVRYQTARATRKRLYEHMGGVDFGPDEIESLLGDSRALQKIGLDENHIGSLTSLCRHVRHYGVPTKAADMRILANHVSGVGQWTTDSALLTCLLDIDVFPSADKWIRRKMLLLDPAPEGGQHRRALSVQEVQQRAKRWAPYKGIAVIHLWRWFDEAEKRANV